MLLRKTPLQITNFTMRKTLKWKDKTCHNSQENVQNVSEFRKIKFRKMRFEKYYYVKRHFLLFSCSFGKQGLIFRTSQCVRLKRSYTTCQISRQTLENVSEVEKSLHSKSHFMNHVTPRKRHFFCIFAAPAKCMKLKWDFFLCIEVL